MKGKVMSKNIIQQCKQCGDLGHKWNEVYYNEKSRLVKAEEMFIAWCANKDNYVLA